jgi:hypothetical protein
VVQLTDRVKPAQTARKDRDPATGEEIMVAAKPASPATVDAASLCRPSRYAHLDEKVLLRRIKGSRGRNV